MQDDATATLEMLWKRSRAGARASSGFRFQDAVAAAASVLCWSGRILGNAVVPESFDDFSIETADTSVFVQVKSKLSDDSSFSSTEIATALTKSVGAPLAAASRPMRVVVIDRLFAGNRYEDWNKSLDQSHASSDEIRSAISARCGDEVITTNTLTTSALITWPNPIALAANEIAKRRAVPLAVALTCVNRLVSIIGNHTDRNASATFATRAKITTGDVDREIDRILNLIDIASVEAAVRRGLVQHIAFETALDEPSFYLGVAAQPGHVAAGLTITRGALTISVLDALFSSHRVLITGPSGAGKSAIAFMAAFESRHACRWIYVRHCEAGDREDFLRFLASQAPSSGNPVVLYVDDAGVSNGSTWDAVLGASLATPGVYAIATAREENVAVLSGVSHCKQIRPALDEPFAEHMWRELKDRNATQWASWQEPFERAKGLLLEYAHILTQGRRLRELVAEQVAQRLKEHRDTEFEFLRLTSAASSLGATVSVSRLAIRLSLTAVECARALQRLLNEHLVRMIGDDDLAGLHELRSQCILDSCLTLVPGTIQDARSEALAVVSADGARTLIAAAVRAHELDETAAVKAVASRLHETPEPALLVSSLEGLRICALDHDAEAFKTIADRHGVSARHYFLVTVMMGTEISDSNSPVLQLLGKVRDEFGARTVLDHRRALLDEIGSAALNSLLSSVNSAGQSLALMRATIGVDLPDDGAALLALTPTFTSASMEDISAFLAVGHELAPSLAKAAVDALGGTRALLDRLWRETPWALRPSLVSHEDGVVELFADLVAVEGKLVTEPDSIMFEYGARALALAPDAQKITSRPVQIHGEAIVIKGFSPGLKSFGRGSVRSAGAIAWNRLLLHAVAMRYAAASTTEVMQRRKESIEIAARLLEQHADRRCRSQKATSRQLSEIKALELLEDFFPSMPLEKPEVALSHDMKADLTDPGGELITDVAMTIRRLYDSSVNADALAHELERTEKAVHSCRKDSRWNYVGGPPSSSLDQIGEITRQLADVFTAVGTVGDSMRSAVLMPSHQMWSKGTGVRRAYERATALAHRKLLDVSAQLRATLSDSAKIAIATRPTDKRYHWPRFEFCVLVECSSVVDFFNWIGEHVTLLQFEAAKVAGLTTAPLIAGRVLEQCAISIFDFGVIRDNDFQDAWADHVDRPLFKSEAVDAFADTIENTLLVYAPAQLIGDRELLPVEKDFLAAAREKAEAAFKRMQELLEKTPSEAGDEAQKFAALLNAACQDISESEGRPAVAIAKEVVPSFTMREPSQIQTNLIGIRTLLIEQAIIREKQAA